MEAFLEAAESILYNIVELGIIGFEFVGVIVLIVAGVRGTINYIRREPGTRLMLAQGMSMSLGFKLGSEILRTVTVRKLSEIAIVAGIIVLRVSLTVVLHWEMTTERKELKEEAEEKSKEHAA